MTATSGDLRARQLSDTRARIARAVVDVITREGLASLSFPSVADQAGVSLRTVYRHFPNKEALVDAATYHGTEDVLEAFPLEQRTLAAMPEFLPLLWKRLLADRELLEIQTLTPAGQELRTQRLHQRKVECIAAIREDVGDLPAEDLDAIGALLSVLMSSSVALDLVDRLGLDIDTAAAVTTFALDALVEHARTQGAIR